VSTKKILIVDDEEDICTLLKAQLTSEGFDVTGVYSGTKAIDELQARDYDIAIIDVRLPDINGVEILRTIRKSKPGTFVIMITAYDDPIYQQEAEKLGVASYLFKPFQPKTISELCKKLAE